MRIRISMREAMELDLPQTSLRVASIEYDFFTVDARRLKRALRRLREQLPR